MHCTVPVHTYTYDMHAAIWTIHNLNGNSSASFTMPCTIIWSRCSSARRKTGPIDAREACEPPRAKIEQEILDHGAIPFSRYMEIVSLRSRVWLLFARHGEFGEAGIFILPAMCTQFLAGCWPAVRRDVARARLARKIDPAGIRTGSRAVCPATYWIGRRRSFPISSARCTIRWRRVRPHYEPSLLSLSAAGYEMGKVAVADAQFNRPGSIFRRNSVWRSSFHCLCE